MADAGGIVIKDGISLSYKSDGSSAYAAGGLVKLSADETVTPTTAQGENCIGVVIHAVSATEAAAGMSVSVLHQGVCWLVADQAITRMAPLCSGTTTYTYADPATTDDYVFGKALTAAAGSGKKFQAIVDFCGASSVF